MHRSAMLLLVFSALFALDALLGLGVFWEHDLRLQHIPWRVWAAEEWAQGRVPLWATGVGNGFPLAADGQTGVFYLPTMLLFVLLPAAWAVNLSILGHIAWAAEGTRRLMIRLGGDDSGAMIAAVIFAFSGFMTTHIGYLGMQNAAAWLPWLVWATVGGRWAPIGVCAAMMMMAGHPQIAAVGLLGVFAVAVWCGNTRVWLGGMALAVLAASPQILATAELISQSVRAGGMSASLSRTGAMPIQELVSTVLPSFFGFERPADMVQSYVHRADGYFGGGVSHWDTTAYLGVPAILLACLGLRAGRFWLGVSVVSVLLMVASPLWDLLRMLPIFDNMRYPARFSIWLSLAVAVLAGHGFSRMVQHRALDKVAGQWLWWTGMGVAALAVIGTLFERRQNEFFERFVRRYARRSDWSPQQAEDRARQIVDGLLQSVNPFATETLIAAGMALVFVLLAFLHSRMSMNTKALGVLVLVLTYADLWRYGHDYNPRTPRAAVDALPETLSELGAEMSQGRIAVVDRRRQPELDIQLLNASIGLQYGVSDVLVPSPLRNRRNDALLEKVGLDIGERGPAKWDKVLAHMNLINLMGIRWLLSEHERSSIQLIERMKSPVYVYENPDAMPHAFVVSCARVTKEPFAALDELQPDVWAVIETDLGLPDCEASELEWEVTVEHEEPHHRVMTVESSAAGLLVLAESWNTGWHVRVNGSEQAIHRANWAFRGVPVPAGTTRVEWWYRPRWMTFSFSVASVMWLVLLVGCRRRSAFPE